MESPSYGLHEQVPFDVYKSWPLMNFSTLAKGLVSPKHMKAAMDGLYPETDTQRFGRAVHCKLLEPDRFMLEYQVATNCRARIKSGDRKGEECKNVGRYFDGRWWCGTHRPAEAEEPRNVITADELRQVEAIYASVIADPVVNLIRQQGGCEMSAVWDCERIRAKCRFDKLILAGNIPPTILDIKKVSLEHAGEEEFSRSILRWNYHVQASFYVDAVASLTGKDAKLLWVVVEDASPFEVSVFQIDADSLKIGREIYKSLASLYCRCIQDDFWPGSSWDSTKQRYVVRYNGIPIFAKRRFLS